MTPSVAGKTVQQDAAQPSTVVVEAERRLHESHHFRGRCRNVDVDYESGVLVVSGAVPSFYLKQVLQSLLRNIDGVHRVENRVDVVSSEGLSSVR